MAKFKLATADVEALFALLYELKDMRVERSNAAAARRMAHEAQLTKSMKREQPDRLTGLRSNLRTVCQRIRVADETSACRSLPSAMPYLFGPPPANHHRQLRRHLSSSF